jgi:hypothetical protein
MPEGHVVGEEGARALQGGWGDHGLTLPATSTERLGEGPDRQAKARQLAMGENAPSIPTGGYP